MCFDNKQKSDKYTVSYIADNYCVFVTKDFKAMHQVAKILKDALSNMNSSQIIKFDSEFRMHTSLNWFKDWKQFTPTDLKGELSDEEYQWVLRVGTFHPNGFYREKCLCELSHEPENLPYFIIRINDWAKPIRELALSRTLEIIDNISTKPIDVIKVFLYFDKVENGIRKENDTFEILMDKVFRIIEHGLQQNELQQNELQQYKLQQNELQQINAKDFIKFEMKLKKVLYKRFYTRIFVHKEYINELIKLEKCSYLKMLLVNASFKHNECTSEEIDMYLKDKYAMIRKAALYHKYEQVKGYWAGAEDMLMDGSKGIREMIYYILQKHTKIDILSYYEDKLKISLNGMYTETNGEYKTKKLTTDELAAVISGIGENGSVKAGSDKLIMPYLKHGSIQIVRSALRAISLLLKEKGEDIYWEYLFDHRVSVSKCAYLMIVKCGINYGSKNIMEAFDSCSQNYTKNYLIKLLLHEPSWERLPYLLKLYNYDSNLVYKIRSCAGFRDVYAKITSKLASEIREILTREDLNLPEKLKKDIEFDLQHIVIKN